MSFLDDILNFTKNIFTSKSEQKTVVSLREQTQELQKSRTRIIQENKLLKYKEKTKIIDNPEFLSLVTNLEEKMNQYPLMEFDDDFFKIKDFLDTKLDDKSYFLLNYDKVYKFSKSNYSLTKYFAESHWCEYNESRGYACDDNKPLSVTVNEKLLLSCAMYGDQLTIFTNNPENKIYEQLKNADIKHVGSSVDEWTSTFLIIEKNLSLSDPYVLKILLKNSEIGKINDYFSRKIKGKSFGEIYKEIGFLETSNFYYTAKNEFKQNNFTFKDKLDELLPDKEKSVMLDKLINILPEIYPDTENVSKQNDIDKDDIIK